MGTVLGVAVAAVVLAMAWALLSANASRSERGSRLHASSALTASPTFHARSRTDGYAGRPWTTVLAAADTDSAPVPPGLSRFPKDGEVWVSPALAELVGRDPAAARRLPGRVVGTVQEAGLESPDQLLSVVGLARGSIAGAVGSRRWGVAYGSAAGALVPQHGLTLTVAALVGIPLLVFAAVVARLSSSARRRRAAALHLLGATPETLARAAATEAALHSLAGTVLGLAAAAVVIPVVADSGVLGLRWFSADTPVSAPLAASVVLLLPCAVGAAAAAGTRRALQDVLQARHRPERAAGPLRMLPLTAALSVLATFWVLGNAAPHTVLSTGPLSGLAVAAMCVGAAGALTGMPLVVATLGHRLPSRRSGALLLARRRLSYDAQQEVRSTAGVVLVLITSLIGVGVLTDLRRLQDVPGARNVVWVSTPTVRGAEGALAAAATALAVQPSAGDGPSNELVASCAALVAFTNPDDADARQELAATCRDGLRLRVVDARTGQPSPAAPGGAGGPGRVTVGPADARATEGDLPVRHLDRHPLLSSAAVVSTDEASADPRRARGGVVWALLPEGAQTVQRFATAAFAADPRSDVGELDRSATMAYQYPLLRRIVQGCTGLGIAIAVAAFLIGAMDRTRERRRQATGLLVMGAPKRVLCGADLVQSTATVACAALVGSVVGWLSGGTYVTMGGHRGWFAEALPGIGWVSATALVVTALVTVASSVLATRTIDPALIRRE